MATIQESPESFLSEAYKRLDFGSGKGFYPVSASISNLTLSQISWFEQAKEIGAEAIYFVEDYPAVLFFKLDEHLGSDTSALEDKIRELHIKVWNTSRVPVFFVALPGELRIYSAYQKPSKTLKEWRSSNRWLDHVKAITQIAEMADFSRQMVESGHLFTKFSNEFELSNRVDNFLLNNLRLLREKLEGGEPGKRKHIHALIGRSIFIRYLEDRKILTKEYFSNNRISRHGDYRTYTETLNSKYDTYSLFKSLREDFNGDLFVLSEDEENYITEQDLHMLADFLQGKSIGLQLDLFFWAYKFDIIPIELISNIYEEFYHVNNDEFDDKGTHYTPMQLVNFILSESLTLSRLDSEPKVLDPACGSGIFLVEAFKRIVYHECNKRGIGVKELPRETLAKFLTERVVGIDVNDVAIQIAAFSLYLAFLNFIEPPDIQKNKKLPKLIYHPDSSNEGKTLFNTNAFCLTNSEAEELDTSLKEQNGNIPNYTGWIREQEILPLTDQSFDVIVGNPPWGAAKASSNKHSIEWCKTFKYPVGDMELSQSFIWRVQRLLKPGGEIGLLVSSGILFKHNPPSKEFRRNWLLSNSIRVVYNFSHVRHVFFRKQKKGSIAPFVAVFFKPDNKENIYQNRISIVSVKQKAFVNRLQAVIIDKADLHKVSQIELATNDWLWKTYMWGNQNDAEFIAELKSCHKPFYKYVSVSSRGFKEGGSPKNYTTADLKVDYELDVRDFGKKAPFSQLVKPIKFRRLHRIGKNVYTGPRLLVKRGISRSGKKNGEIQARLAHEPFAFPSSLIGFCIEELNFQYYPVVLGIMLSSLAKYYYFLTCSTWGLWHDEIHEEEHLGLPICLTDDDLLQSQIEKSVNQLMTKADTPSLIDPSTPGWQSMQAELDKTIYRLYQLSESQIDLVNDFKRMTLGLYYDGIDSDALKAPSDEWIKEYCETFTEIWDERLLPRLKQLDVEIYYPANSLVCGVSFSLGNIDREKRVHLVNNDPGWQTWLRRLGFSLKREYSEGIYLDRVVKVIEESSFLIIKRVERRLWTRSQARQDAQEFLAEVFKLEWEMHGARQ